MNLNYTNILPLRRNNVFELGDTLPYGIGTHIPAGKDTIATVAAKIKFPQWSEKVAKKWLR